MSDFAPMSMLPALTKAIGSNPADDKVMELLKQFEQEAFLQKQAGEERTADYRSLGKERGAEIKAAGERAATPKKWGTADYAMTAASLVLPIIGALLPQGKGRRGQRAQAGQQQALTGLGKGLGAVQQYRLGREEKGREQAYEGAMAGFEHRGGLADMIYQGQGKQAATQLGAAGELMRGGIAAQRESRLGRPQAEKGLPPGLINTMNRQAQTDMQKAILVQANQIIQPLEVGGVRFTLKTIQDLDSMIFELEQGDALHMTRGLPPALPSKANAVAPVLAQLKELRNQYDTGLATSTGRPPDMTDAEWQEYLQMKGQR